MAFISNFNDVKDGYLCHLFKNIVIKWHIKKMNWDLIVTLARQTTELL